jgi:recombinational DNA repair protein (RecF pathway)
MSAAVELFLQIDFTDGDSEDTYLLLKNYFVFLKDSPYNQFLLFIRLALRTLQYIGIPLELCCHKCGNSEVIYFAPQEDAFLCENCTDRRMSDFLLSIDRDAVASLRNVYNLKNEDPDHTSEAIVLDFKKILLTHLENHFNKRFYLKSLEDY